MMPSTWRKIFGLYGSIKEVGASAAISAVVIWGLRLLGVDIFDNFESPIYGFVHDTLERFDGFVFGVTGWRIPWFLWTTPYAVGTYFFWNTGLSMKWDPLKVNRKIKARFCAFFANRLSSFV